jgi:hypothetical protein
VANDDLFLPRAEDAEIAEEKLRHYVLDPDHHLGKHKARVFQSALGIGQDDWQYLRDQILERLPGARVTAIRPKPPHGLEYEARMPIDGLNGETRTIITGWLVAEDQPPRLLTTYVEVAQRG